MKPSYYATGLTLAGIIPFALCVAVVFFTPNTYNTIAAHIFISYAAVILSFLAGTHWGLALGKPNKTAYVLFTTSNISALLAFAALAFQNLAFAFCMLASGLILQLFIDLRLYHYGILEKWYTRLRAVGTGIVLLLLFLLWIWVEKLS